MEIAAGFSGGYSVFGRSAFQTDCFFFLLFFEVPGHSFFQSFVKVSLRLVAELFAGAGDVGEGVLNVTGAFWAVDRLGSEAELAGDGGVDLVEGVAFSCTDVEDAAGSDVARSETGEEVGADGVVDEVEVAAGEAVAEDGGGFACHHLEGELGDDSRVRRVGGLAWAEDVEVTQADALKAVGAIGGLDVVLAGELLHSVGRQGTRKHVLLFGLGGLVSVGRGGGCVDDAANLCVACCD